jgi:hypothetical protein
MQQRPLRTLQGRQARVSIAIMRLWYRMIPALVPAHTITQYLTNQTSSQNAGALGAAD